MWSPGQSQNKVIFVTLSLLQLARGDRMVSNYSFPDDFLFGVGTAAYQIEGGWNEGGKGESVWDVLTHDYPEAVVDHKNGDVADDSYHLWREDIELIKSLGVSAYRMSIAWTRILPNGTDDNINEEGVKYYRRIFEELQKANITPVVTIFHWDMPVTLMNLGGWANPQLVDFYEDYARIVFKLFGDIVKMWLTVNEPHENCQNSYVLRSIGLYLCTHNNLLAHARAYRLYEKEFKPHQQGKVSIALDAFWADPKDPNKPEDVEAAEQYLQMHVGMLAHPIFSDVGDYPSFVRERVDNKSREQGYSRSRLPYFTPEEVKALRGSADFIGLNHYTTYLMSPTKTEPSDEWLPWDFDTDVTREQDPSWPKPGTLWLAVHPQGFRKILNWLQNTYKIFNKIPILVTENGCTDGGQLADYERVSYYNDYLNQLLLAIHEDGVNVKGYFAWSLLDTMEWTDGYATKFGIIQVDYDSPNRTRTPKLSAKNYANIVRTRRIDFDYIESPWGHNTYANVSES